MNHQIRPDEWGEYEKPLGNGTETVANCLADCVSQTINEGDGSFNSFQTSHPSAFPEGFDELRRTVKKGKTNGFAEKFGVSANLTIGYTSTIPNKKKEDKIRLSNTTKKYKGELEKLSMDGKYIPKPVGTGLIDFKILELIVYMNAMINMPRKKVDMSKAYEAFFGIGNILENISDITVKHHTTGNEMKIPQMYIQPLDDKYSQFVERFHFDFEVASSEYPKFFYSTEFDKILPGMSVKPYESQSQLLNFVSTNIGNPFMCVLNTLMGMGKTWVAGYVGLMIHLHNLKHRDEKTFIYTCPETLKSVRYIVGKILHRLDIPFAIAYVENGKVVIHKSYSCIVSRKPKKIYRNPAVILAGVQATIKLLKGGFTGKSNYEMETESNVVLYERSTREKTTFIKEDYMVFFDEPTMAMDSEQSQMVPYLAEFLQNLPPQTIFSSATHRPIEECVDLSAYVETKYDNVVFGTVDYSKVLIGTQINNIDGSSFIPHSLCETDTDLERFINIVETNLMYKKFYTIPLVRAMYNKIIDLGLNLDLPSNLVFDNWMNELSHRNQESVQNLGVEYLKFILTQYKSSNDPTLIPRFNAIKKTNTPINFNNLVESSRILSGQTFISCSNPKAFLEEKFGSHFQQAMGDIGIRSFEDIYSKYKKQKAILEKKEQSLSKAKSTKGDEKLSKLERARADGESSTNIDISEIPRKFKLGAGTGTGVSIANAEWDNIVATDVVKFAALFGIFIYSEDSHHTYNDFVVNVISREGAVYVLADSTLNYGNSFPFNNGIITNDMGIHSDKTLLQLMARAGRPGVSHTANIYAEDAILDKIQSAIHNPEYVDIEFNNLNRVVELAIQNDLKAIQEAEEAERKAEQSRLRAEQEAEREAEQSRLRAEQEAEREAEQSRLRAEQEAQLNARWGRQRTLETRETRSEGSQKSQSQSQTSTNTSQMNWTRGQRL
jgi:hypothetical protein